MLHQWVSVWTIFLSLTQCGLVSFSQITHEFPSIAWKTIQVNVQHSREDSVMEKTIGLRVEIQQRWSHKKRKLSYCAAAGPAKNTAHIHPGFSCGVPENIRLLSRGERTWLVCFGEGLVALSATFKSNLNQRLWLWLAPNKNQVMKTHDISKLDKRHLTI